MQINGYPNITSINANDLLLVQTASDNAYKNIKGTDATASITSAVQSSVATQSTQISTINSEISALQSSVNTNTSNISTLQANTSIPTTYAQLADIKGTNAFGGAYSTANTAITRTLNSVVSSASWLSLSSNIFTLQPGTYIIDATVPGFSIGLYRAWLDNAGTAIILGTSEYNAPSATVASTRSRVNGKIIITSTTAYSIKFSASAANTATYALGQPANVAGQGEIYTQVNIMRIA